MDGTTIDLREIAPPDRHEAVYEAFEDLDSGSSLELINDHDPKPLFYEMAAEVPSFDEEGYAVEQRGPQTFVALFPKEA
ncbi:MAG: DUF2249 domain-containing protein [Halanaeroarchaeum sp.]